VLCKARKAFTRRGRIIYILVIRGINSEASKALEILLSKEVRNILPNPVFSAFPLPKSFAITFSCLAPHLVSGSALPSYNKSQTQDAYQMWFKIWDQQIIQRTIWQCRDWGVESEYIITVIRSVFNFHFTCRTHYIVQYATNPSP